MGGLNKKFIKGGRKMYKKILVPLDGSELAECTLNHVRAIAAGCQVPEVVLLMVMEPIPSQVYAEVPEDTIREAEKRNRTGAEDYLSKLAHDLKKDGIATKSVLVLGRAADEILDYVNKNQVDLIVMSTHGRSGISRWVWGSVADRVLHHSRVPVWQSHRLAVEVASHMTGEEMVGNKVRMPYCVPVYAACW